MDIRSLIGTILPIVIFGFSFGLYEVLFPLYMNFLNISLLDMGFTFTISALVVTVMNIFIGKRSDILGRKIFFSLALLLGGISHLTTSFSSSLIPLTILKILFDLSVAIKNAVFVPMLFDQDRKNFISTYSRMSGLEFIFQAVGLATSGFLVELLEYKITFIFSGILQILGFITFSILFTEASRNKARSRSNEKNSFFKFPRSLGILSISGLILSIGSSASHSFITPLFFSDKFALSPIAVSVLMTIHRLSLGIPLMYSDKIINRLKRFQLKIYLMLFV
ncbi:MAG: MFS transporter, partial [Thermoproteota archaeon]